MGIYIGPQNLPPTCRTTSFATALPLCVLSNTTVSKISEMEEVDSKLRHAFGLQLGVFGEDIQRKGMLSATRQPNLRVCQAPTHLSLMISIASSISFTATMGRTGPKISLSCAESVVRSVGDGCDTYSSMVMSSNGTSLMTVGAMNFACTSFSPPKTILPLVLSINFLILAACPSETMRA